MSGAKKVVTKLMGGLGNQMLQYATGWSLSQKLDAQLLLDTEYFKIDHKLNNTHREFELNIFGIGFRPYKSLLSNHIINKLVLKVPGVRKGLLPILNTRYLTDRDDMSVIGNTKSGMIYLDGYWTAFRLFDDHRNGLKKIFDFEPLLHGINKELAQRLQQEQSVAVHVRRTDYLLPNSSQPALGRGYYENAMAYVSNRVAAPKFYFFGDDHKWIKENFSIDGERCFLVDHNKGSNSCLDMALMSRCRNIIISNSTFSWWSAYLDANKDPVIVAPDKWFLPGRSPHFKYNEFIPAEWVTIEA